MMKYSPKQVTGLKYIDIRPYWLRQVVNKEYLKIEHVEIARLSDDGLIKYLSEHRHKIFPDSSIW